MKTRIIFVMLLCCGLATTTNAQFKIGKKINVEKAIQAGTDVAKAVTLSDADIIKICGEYMEWMDSQNPLATPDSEYGKRLTKMVGHISEVEGKIKVNFGVYEVTDVNAFACGDGSIRICGGLMDVMTDDEVMAVIGHEIGHLVNTDTKDAMKNAYLRSAAANAAGAVSTTAAKMTDSDLGTLAQAFAGAQFSQKQENQADDYAFKFCIENKIDPYAMGNSLNKLVEMYESGGEKSSKIQQLFSTHPDSAKRAKRMTEKADKYTGK